MTPDIILIPKRVVAKTLDIHPNSVPKLVARGLLTPHQTLRGIEYDKTEVKRLQRRIGASNNDHILTAAEAAHILGVHRNTVNLKRKRGDLKGYKFPGSNHYRYRQSDVEAHIEASSARAR